MPQRRVANSVEVNRRHGAQRVFAVWHRKVKRSDNRLTIDLADS